MDDPIAQIALLSIGYEELTQLNMNSFHLINLLGNSGVAEHYFVMLSVCFICRLVHVLY